MVSTNRLRLTLSEFIVLNGSLTPAWPTSARSEMAHLRGWFCRLTPQCIGFRRQTRTEPATGLRDEPTEIDRWPSVGADEWEALCGSSFMVLFFLS